MKTFLIEYSKNEKCWYVTLSEENIADIVIGLTKGQILETVNLTVHGSLWNSLDGPAGEECKFYDLDLALAALNVLIAASPTIGYNNEMDK